MNELMNIEQEVKKITEQTIKILEDNKIKVDYIDMKYIDNAVKESLRQPTADTSL